MYNEEHIKTLVTLGLSGRQARICWALSLRGISTVKEITEETRIARPDTYRALVELENKGFIEKILSNPVKYKVLPLPELLSLLMGQKEAENIQLQERSAALLKDCQKNADQKTPEEGEFILIPSGKAFVNRLNNLIQNCEKTIFIISNQKKLASFLDSIDGMLTKKNRKEIHIRLVTEKCRNNNLTEFVFAIQKRANLEVRFAPILPPFSLVIFDQKETLIIMNQQGKNNCTYATYSNNASLVELSQSYFNDAWFSAAEPSRLAFKKNQLQFDNLFTNMLNGFAYCKMIFKDGEPVDFFYIQINDAFERKFGLKRSQVIGKRVTKIFPQIKGHPALIETYGRVSCTGKPEEFEYFFKPFNMWLHLSVYAPVKGYFAIVFEDITERKKAEEALMQNKRLIDAVFASIKDAVIIFSTTGQVLEFNDAFVRVYGFKNKEEVPKDLMGFFDIFEFYLSDGTLMKDFTVGNAFKEKAGQHDHVMRRRDSGQTWVMNNTISQLRDEKGDLMGIVVSLQDITERKNNEEKLQQLNRTLKAISNSNQAVICSSEKNS